MEFTNMNFDFNTMTGDKDPFAVKGNYEEDTRFYKLEKDKNGRGAAIIRFLPDGDLKSDGTQGTFLSLFKINAQDRIAKKFVNEWSPATIGLPDPFQERFSELWNKGEKEKAKKYGRQNRVIVNIKVIKDPAKPENEGKIFLFDMSKSLAEKVKNYMSPSEMDMKLGATPKNLMNPLKGYSFRLVSSKGDNDIINYDSSSLDEVETSIYSSVEEAVKDIKENCYKLSDWLKPEAYKSYDELKKKLDFFENVDSNEPQILTDNSAAIKVETTNTNSTSNLNQGLAQSAQSVNQTNPPFDTSSGTTSSNNQEDELSALLAGLSK